MTPKARTGLKDVADIVSSFREQMEHLAVAEILELLITRLQFYRYLDDGSIQGESRVENVKELISVAKGYSGNSLADFLEEAALVSDTFNRDRITRFPNLVVTWIPYRVPVFTRGFILWEHLTVAMYNRGVLKIVPRSSV
jgi:superfamily I DNA/RNA helicase